MFAQRIVHRHALFELDSRTYLIIIRAPRCRSDDREVGVAPQRQGTPLAKARNDLIDRPSGNPFNEHEFVYGTGRISSRMSLLLPYVHRVHRGRRA